MNKNICILSPVHRYSDIRVYQKEARTLVKNGYKVTLIAKEEEKVDPIDGINLQLIPNFKSRIKRYLYNPLLLFKALKTQADIFHLHNPDTLFIGYILKLLNKKVIYDTHEDFSKRILMKKWIPKILRLPLAKSIFFIERVAASKFDAFIVTQKNQLNQFKGNVFLIENPPIIDSNFVQNVYSLSEKIEKDENIFRLIYVGGINEDRGLFNMIKVLELLNNHINCRMWLIGSFAYDKDYENAIKYDGWKYVDYLGYLSLENAYSYMIKSDLGLAIIKDVGDHKYTSANKIFEYNMFGLPFIASNFSKWMNDLNRENSGIFVDPNNLDEIARKILEVKNDRNNFKQMSENGKKYIFNKFNWDIESQKLLKIYNDLLN